MRQHNETRVSLFSAFLCSIYLTFVACFPAFATPESSNSADMRATGPYVKLLGGVNFTLDSDFQGSGSGNFPSGSAEFEAGLLTGLGAGYRFSRGFAAELEYMYRSNDISSIRQGGATLASKGDLASVAIMANVFYFPEIGQAWRPYFGAGIGFLQEIDSDVSFSDGSMVEDLEDETFAWQAMLGVEVPLSPEWFLLVEGRYLSAPSPSLSNSNGGYDIDYDNASVLLGVGYQF